MGALVVQSAVLPLEVGHGELSVAGRDGLHAAFGKLLEIEDLVPIQVVAVTRWHALLLVGRNDGMME
jgi:hypothetical protein